MDDVEELEIAMDYAGQHVVIKLSGFTDPLIGLGALVRFVEEGYADSLAGQLMDPDGDWEELDADDEG